MKNLLLDTDVILDFFFDRKPFSEDASVLLSLCEKQQLNAYITPVSISNIYYILRRVSSHEKIIDKLKQLLSIVHILAMDEHAVQKALYSRFKDFEDALQHFAALESGKIEVIVTRNVKDYKHSQIGVMDPESFVKMILSKEP